MKVNGYTIRHATPTGGKAGKGRNKTSTIQVFDGDFKRKEFRYCVGDTDSEFVAMTKAERFAKAL